MSVTNTPQRRTSFVLFLSFFLIAVLISCMAFVQSIGIKEKFPIEELKELKEKEAILTAFSELSQALCHYDNTQKSNPLSVNKEHAKCQRLAERMYLYLEKKDTTRIYADVAHFMKMAEQYMFSIEQLGSRDSDVQIKSLNGQLGNLRTKVNQLQSEKTTIQTEKITLESEKNILQSQLTLLQNSQQMNSGGGSGSSGGSSGDTGSGNSEAPVADCSATINELNAYKMKVLTISNAVKLNVQTIKIEADKIKHVVGVANNKKKKENINKSIIQLGQALEKLEE